VAGGAWILRNLKGIIEDRCAWGLGRKTNNQVEALGVFFGLSVA